LPSDYQHFLLHGKMHNNHVLVKYHCPPIKPHTQDSVMHLNAYVQ